MKTILLSLTIILTSCSSQHFQGIWKQDHKSFTATIIFKENYNCIFGFAPKGATGGISPRCTYKVQKNIITVIFPTKKTKAVDKMVLKYDEKNHTLTELNTGRTYLGFKFIKYKKL